MKQSAFWFTVRIITYFCVGFLLGELPIVTTLVAMLPAAVIIMAAFKILESHV